MRIGTLLRGAAVLVAAGGAAWGVAYWRHLQRARQVDARLRVATREQAEKRGRFEKLRARDPLLARLRSAKGEVVVAMRTGFARHLLEEVATHYLERVSLDLGPIRLRQSGTVRAKVLVGRITAGEWTLELDVRRLRGSLRAGTPATRVLGDDRIGVTLPVNLDASRGEATVRFRWNSRRLANLVCRDFEVVERIDGSVVAGTYTLQGAFTLAATRDAVTARPRLDPLRLKLDLSPDSWSLVRRALESQDSFWKCGIALNPGDVIGRLQRLVADGFDVRLPENLLRAVRLPAGFRADASLEGRTVPLSVRPTTLRLTPEAVWYGASVRARGAAGGGSGGH